MTSVKIATQETRSDHEQVFLKIKTPVAMEPSLNGGTPSSQPDRSAVFEKSFWSGNEVISWICFRDPVQISLTDIDRSGLYDHPRSRRRARPDAVEPNAEDALFAALLAGDIEAIREGRKLPREFWTHHRPCGAAWGEFKFWRDDTMRQWPAIVCSRGSDEEPREGGNKGDLLSPGDRWLDREAAAIFLTNRGRNTSAHELAKLASEDRTRKANIGPPYNKRRNGRCFYRQSLLSAWCDDFLRDHR